MQLLIEFISDVQKFFLNFGLYANTKRLLDTNPPKGDHLACLDGLRFISISWVMLGHILTAEMNFFPLTNIAFFTQVKFMFSKKATKIDKIFIVDLTLCSKCQIYGEDFMHELY